MSSGGDLWERTLEDLELQLASATYQTHLAHTRSVSVKGDVVVVEAKSDFSMEWLNDQLNAVITETLVHMAGRAMSVVFVGPRAKPKAMDPHTEQPDALVKYYDFDILTRGWVHVPSYAIKFWMPLVGMEAFGSYLLLRAIYYNELGAKWTRTRTVYLQLLADTVGCHRQTLVGRSGARGKLWNLVDEGIAHIKVTGNTKTRRYVIKVLVNLPLLTPEQLAKLPSLLRREHRDFLIMAKLEETEWEQLSLGKGSEKA